MGGFLWQASLRVTQPPKHVSVLPNSAEVAWLGQGALAPRLTNDPRALAFAPGGPRLTTVIDVSAELLNR